MARRTGQNDRLRRAREERNWTQADVAQAIGTSTITVSRWELGVQAPQPHLREKLCSLFTLSPQELGLVATPASRNGLSGPAGAEAEAEAHGEDRAEARARRDLRAQVWRYWIETELEAAVGCLPRIELALTERPDVVDDALRVGPAAGQPDRPLPSGTPVEEAYARAGEQLLVLGDPGAGKTTTLLDLARTLLERAADAPSGPMPVVFHLSSWTEARQPLGRWLVEELHRRYGVAPRLGRAWIAGEQVVPLLDGLDEVAEEHRAACVEAINAFHGEHGQLPLVVCCRTAQYRSLGVRLRLRGGVAIGPLTREQVERFLAEGGEAMAEVRALLHEDDGLRELLTTPLFLSMAVRAYGREGAARPPPRGPLAERRRRVLADYVDEMLTRPRAGPGALAFPPAQTAGWLAWLARAMHDHGDGVFYLDWMQPSWLPAPAQRRLVRLAPAVLVVLVGGLVGVLDMLLAGVLLRAHAYLLNVGGGVRVDLPGQLAEDALAGAAVGVVAGLLAAAFTYERRIAPSSRLAWSWSTFRRNLPSVLAAVLGAMLLSLLVDRVLSGLVVHLVYGVLLVLLFGALTGRRRRWQLAALLGAALVAAAAVLIASGAPLSTLLFRLGARLLVGLSLGLMFGPETPLLETVPAPGQAIELSRRHGLAAGAVSGALAALVFGAVAGAGVGTSLGTSLSTSVALVTGVVDGACMGMIVAVGVGMRRGLGAYVRHALLRRLMVAAGAAPPDYVGFLEHASNLVLLRRRGGGYEFVHRLLLDHFAQLRRPPARGQ